VPAKTPNCKATASDYKSFMAVDLLVFAGGLGGLDYGVAAAGFIAV
jgi:hypothetical protein